MHSEKIKKDMQKKNWLTRPIIVNIPEKYASPDVEPLRHTTKIFMKKHLQASDLQYMFAFEFRKPKYSFRRTSIS